MMKTIEVHLCQQPMIVMRLITKLMVMAILALPFQTHAQDIDPTTRITQIVWNPDGNRVATGYRDGRIVVTSLDGEQDSLILQPSNSRILTLAWSPDGRFLASGSGYSDDTLRIWNTTNGNQEFAVSGFGVSILSILWSPDGQYVVAVTAEPFNTPENAIIVDTASWQTRPFLTGAVTDIALNPDGALVAFATTSFTVEVRDISTMQLLTTYSYANANVPYRPGFLNQLFQVVWSPDRTNLAAGTGDGRVVVWRLGTQEPYLILEGNTYQGDDADLAWINDLRFDSTGKYLTSISGNGDLRTWDITDGSLHFEQVITPNYAAEFSPYGGRLAVGLISPVEGDSARSEALDSVETIAGGTARIIVPDPSPERLQAIAEQCSVPPTLTHQLDSAIVSSDCAGIIAQVEAASADTISPACAADLVAVAEAIQGR